MSYVATLHSRMGTCSHELQDSDMESNSKQHLQSHDKIKKDDVNRLLARCTHVEAALNSIGGAAGKHEALTVSGSETPTPPSSCQLQLTTYV